eukprot:RCo023246
MDAYEGPARAGGGGKLGRMNDADVGVENDNAKEGVEDVCGGSVAEPGEVRVRVGFRGDGGRSCPAGETAWGERPVGGADEDKAEGGAVGVALATAGCVRNCCVGKLPEANVGARADVAPKEDGGAEPDSEGGRMENGFLGEAPAFGTGPGPGPGEALGRTPPSTPPEGVADTGT